MLQNHPRRRENKEPSAGFKGSHSFREATTGFKGCHSFHNLLKKVYSSQLRAGDLKIH